MLPKSRFHPLLWSLAVAPGLLSAGVHKCLDANNKTVYQDKPCQEMTSTGLSPALSRLNPQENRPHLLWKLTTGPKTVYLMAALGYGTADMYPLPEPVMDAFGAANVLVVGKEFDAGEGTASLPTVTAKGSYNDGSSLREHLKPAAWQRALDLAQGLNITEETLAALKPWMAALTLKTAALAQAGFDEKLSVTDTFVKAAQGLKPVVGLDLFDDLFKRVESLPDAEQEAFLLEALHEADNKREYFASLVDAWKKGDGDALDMVLRRTIDSLPASQKSQLEWSQSRNEGITAKIDEMAGDGRVYFVVLDAKRLVGEKGLLAGLKAKGYTASQL